MGTDVAVRDEVGPQQMAVLTNEQLQYIARTDFVPPSLRGNLPAILACVATGRSLGLPDMTALRSIHIIDGKATFSAELMVQLVRRRGHSITGEVGDGSATVTGTRADNGDTMTVTWTAAMAERAGLLGKGNWKKYPEAMLWARAASQLCRMLFADCFAGSTYTPGEIEQDAGVEFADTGSEVLAGEPETAATTAREPIESTVSDAPAGTGEQPSLASDPQKKKLNILVGTLRDQGHITTEQVYMAVGHEAVPGEDGVLHWSPLRDVLTRDEASSLIERLERFAETVAEAVA